MAPNPRRKRLLWLGLVALPPAFWLAIIALLPTDWIRGVLTESIEAATGQFARIEAVRVGLWGDVHARGVELAPTASFAHPWLRIADLRIDLGLWRLARGESWPAEVRARGMYVRVLRREDGTFECVGVAHPHNSGGGHHAGISRPEAERPGLTITCLESTIRFLDVPSDFDMTLRSVHGRARWQGRQLQVEELIGAIDGGRVELAAAVDARERPTSFEGQIRAQGISQAVARPALHYLLPLVDEARAGRDCHFDLSVYFEARGDNAQTVRQTLRGRGSLRVERMSWDDVRAVADLAAALRFAPTRIAGSITSEFAIRDERIETQRLILNLGRAAVVLAGSSNFDGQFDYVLRAEGLERLADRLPSAARRIVADLPLDWGDLANVRLHRAADGVVTVEHNDAQRTRSRSGANSRGESIPELGRGGRPTIIR